MARPFDALKADVQISKRAPFAQVCAESTDGLFESDPG